ncbi:unnamed protein product, partial [Mesorhabditis spiculigera]
MSEIPPGDYALELGATFSSSSPATYHTLRYDFKPQSVTADSESYIAVQEEGDVQVVVPSGSDDLTVYKGAQKPVKENKECLLFYDPATGTLRLEKLESNISVKKTRDIESVEALKNEVDRVRNKASDDFPEEAFYAKTTMTSQALPPPTRESPKNPEEMSEASSDDDSSSSSSQSGDSSRSNSRSNSPVHDDSEDELSRALEDQMVAQDSQPPPPVRPALPSVFDQLDEPMLPSKPAPVHKSKTKDVIDDLQLSESSDEGD